MHGTHWNHYWLDCIGPAIGVDDDSLMSFTRPPFSLNVGDNGSMSMCFMNHKFTLTQFDTDTHCGTASSCAHTQKNPKPQALRHHKHHIIESLRHLQICRLADSIATNISNTMMVSPALCHGHWVGDRWAMPLLAW